VEFEARSFYPAAAFNSMLIRNDSQLRSGRFAFTNAAYGSATSKSRQTPSPHLLSRAQKSEGENDHGDATRSAEDTREEAGCGRRGIERQLNTGGGLL
jgi:hypothetical protein